MISTGESHFKTLYNNFTSFGFVRKHGIPRIWCKIIRTMWGPPSYQLVQIRPSNYSYLRTINHSLIGVMFTNLAILGASHCINVYWHHLIHETWNFEAAQTIETIEAPASMLHMASVGLGTFGVKIFTCTWPVLKRGPRWNLTTFMKSWDGFSIKEWYFCHPICIIYHHLPIKKAIEPQKNGFLPVKEQLRDWEKMKNKELGMGQYL